MTKTNTNIIYTGNFQHCYLVTDRGGRFEFDGAVPVALWGSNQHAQSFESAEIAEAAARAEGYSVSNIEGRYGRLVTAN